MKYLVDTNVIIFNSEFYKEFPKAEFVILKSVLGELDELKTKHHNIRSFVNFLLKTKRTDILIGQDPSTSPVDDQLIEYALENNCIVLSNDSIVLLKAKHMGIGYCQYTPKPPKKQDLSRYPKAPSAWGLTPQNPEQNAAILEILDHTKPLVALSGPAGTGKTQIAIAAAMEMCVERGMYNKIYISRPVIPLGAQDIGFLPGSADEKLLPWIQPIFDNIKSLSPSSQKNNRKNTDTSIEYLMESGILEILSLSFIRGRSLSNCIVLIDESQNLSRLELKTILTRAGEGCKIILTGDLDQVDVNNSGYNYMIKQFEDSKLFAHIRLTESVRSPLAKEAGEKL